MEAQQPKPKRVRRTKAQIEADMREELRRNFEASKAEQAKAEAERGKDLAAQVNGLSIPQLATLVDALDPAVAVFIKSRWARTDIEANQ